MAGPNVCTPKGRTSTLLAWVSVGAPLCLLTSTCCPPQQGTQGLISSGGDRFQYSFGTTPGPGAYKPEAAAAPAPGVGALVTTAPRFDVSAPAVAHVPGPGQYNSEPAGGAMHKRTFNLTIAEEEQRGTGRTYYT